ncbi:hypothetical protein [Winogradskyella pacifica]|uniref:hypothetical protein n=1 Tax=Winogradskyella pacifica TaxID=664642 RepID=UPI0015CCE6F7|nr:hypothetical protein [Winogradskyella pacifica]
MIKNISILLVLLLTSISFGQNTVLLQNTNPKAKELKHNLNATKDSLMLSCDSKILKVEIFNENYEQLIIVDANTIQISLKDIPNGNYIIETRLDEKIIPIDLIKHDDYNDASHSSLYPNLEQIIEGKGMMLDEELKVIKSSPNKSIEFILTRGKTKSHSTENQKYFWTETQIINESGSSKTMRLADQKSVDKMIHRHKLEINSDSGKLNKLTVWEVYNKGAFMENQVSNPEFVYSSSTDLYNHTPYYSTANSIQNL